MSPGLAAPRWLHLDAQGVTVFCGKVELGQGIHTALAQIVADELGLPLERVHFTAPHTGSCPDEGVTSGSLSVQESGAALRQACAELRAAHGLAAVPRWVGRSVPRAEVAQTVRGAARFIHDLELPGLRHGRVLHPPGVGDRLRGIVLEAPGALSVLRDGDLVGLLAETNVAADAALDTLRQSAIWQQAAEPAPVAPVPRLVDERVSGHAAEAPTTTLRARYDKPWIAHASIGGACALAHWVDGRLSVWTHSQGIFNLRRDLALAFAVAVADVSVQHVPGAGCYGHNGADDVAFDAAWLARSAQGRPVRVIWSRADEAAWAPQGPAMTVEIEADLDAHGAVLAWRHEIWSPGHSGRPGRDTTPALLGSWQTAQPFERPPTLDMPLARGGGAERNAIPPYALPAWRVRCHRRSDGRQRSSALRSLGAFANVFASESFVDEIAAASGHDPLAWRLANLQHDPRALQVLQAAAQHGGWRRSPRREGFGQGLGFARYKGSGAWCAVIAEVEAAATLRVLRLFIAVDVGLAVNPDGVVQQIEGGAIQATSWALKEDASVAGDAMLRFSEVPAVQTHILPSSAPSLGAGEASLGPTAAAIANALFDALGVRVRQLPLTPDRIVAAIAAEP